MKKKIFALLILLLCAAAALYFFAFNKTKATTYLTEEVKRINLEKVVIASGTVHSLNQVDVGAQVSGKITKLHVTLGQDIQKGELIAEIDSTTQVNMLNTKKAVLASYQSQLNAKKTAYDVAQSSYNRQAKLYAQQSTSLESFNAAKNSLDTAKYEIAALKELIKQAEIEVNTAETNVGYTKITSPITGTVVSIPISQGQTVNANQAAPTIVTVANLDKMLIKPEISEGDITKVKAGQEVSFTILSDYSTQYHAVIESVDPATTTITDARTTTNTSPTAVYYYANLVVDNPNRVLRIGMTTENTIKIAQAQNVLAIPNMALQRQQNKYMVNVLVSENKSEPRQVEIGMQNDFQTEIKSGLKEGEKVILSQLNEGEKVGNSTRGPRIL
ncbi:efflux RND transporter periplasmic adaptor subunit [Pasteurellaceae bacterium 22721_9_1]